MLSTNESLELMTEVRSTRNQPNGNIWLINIRFYLTLLNVLYTLGDAVN